MFAALAERSRQHRQARGGGGGGGGAPVERQSVMEQLLDPVLEMLHVVRTVELRITIQDELGHDGLESCLPVIKRANAHLERQTKGKIKTFAVAKAAIAATKFRDVQLSPELESHLRRESMVNNWAGFTHTIRLNRFADAATAVQAALCMNEMMNDPFMFGVRENEMALLKEMQSNDADWRMRVGLAYSIVRTKFKPIPVHFSNMGTSYCIGYTSFAHL